MMIISYLSLTGVVKHTMRQSPREKENSIFESYILYMSEQRAEGVLFSPEAPSQILQKDLTWEMRLSGTLGV